MADPSKAKEWALFFELRNGTGARQQERYIDALALNLWPSSGLRRVAYEIKVSRADFARELAQPMKRAWGLEVSHEFWFAVAHGVCDKTEVPADCGLLIATKDGSALKVAKHAPSRTPRDWTPAEVAALARRSVEPHQFTGPRWKHAGRDLDAAALVDLLQAERSTVEAAEVAERITEGVRKALEPIKARLNEYARDMAKAGIEPPAWMVDGNLLGCEAWHAGNWAQTLCKPGVDALAGRVKSQIDALTRTIEPIRQTLAAIEREARQGQREEAT
jgi:hypothetical protein